MTHTSTEQPEALQYATALRSNSVFFTPKYMGFIADELERLHARVQELEASQAQRAPLTDAECDSLISALCPDFCDESFPGDRPILRQLAKDALNPNLGITAIDSHITQDKQG